IDVIKQKSMGARGRATAEMERVERQGPDERRLGRPLQVRRIWIRLRLRSIRVLVDININRVPPNNKTKGRPTLAPLSGKRNPIMSGINACPVVGASVAKYAHRKDRRLPGLTVHRSEFRPRLSCATPIRLSHEVVDIHLENQGLLVRYRGCERVE